MTTPLLTLDNLHVAVEGKPILNGLHLAINDGEIHALMGPNGSGKSTLAFALAGREGYEPRKGEMRFQKRDLSALAPEERARLGLFLGFQQPVDIPGLGVMPFLRAALNAKRQARGEEEISPADFLRLCRGAAERLGISEELLRRNVNDGFSGGEKKRLEILQMTILKPRLAILDEIDSGLDIDALKLLGHAVNALREDGMAALLITHYRRLLEHLALDKVHLLRDGKIARRGGAELAEIVEREGYAA